MAFPPQSGCAHCCFFFSSVHWNFVNLALCNVSLVIWRDILHSWACIMGYVIQSTNQKTICFSAFRFRLINFSSSLSLPPFACYPVGALFTGNQNAPRYLNSYLVMCSAIWGGEASEGPLLRLVPLTGNFYRSPLFNNVFHFGVKLAFSSVVL